MRAHAHMVRTRSSLTLYKNYVFIISTVFIKILLCLRNDWNFLYYGIAARPAQENIIMPMVGDEYIPFPKVYTDDLYEKVKALLEPQEMDFDRDAVTASPIEITPPCRDADEFYARLSAAFEREKNTAKPTRRKIERIRLGVERVSRRQEMAARPKLSLRLVEGYVGS
jgi:hypothetical protein